MTLSGWTDGVQSHAPVPFHVDISARYGREQVTQHWSDRPRPTTEAVEAAIARTWETETALAAQEGRDLFDGKLGRLIHADATPASLHLELGATCYRDFVGTNVRNAEMVLATVPGGLADPLGISATVVTSDGSLAYGRRSRRVACHGGYLHTFGGMLEEADRREDGYDVFGSALRELHEEIGLHQDEVEDIAVSGLVRDRGLRQPGLLFEVTVSLSRDRIAGRFAPDLADGEHTAIEFVPDEREAIVPFLEHARPVAPIAQAAVLLHGRHRWGPAWYDLACRQLYGPPP